MPPGRSGGKLWQVDFGPALCLRFDLYLSLHFWFPNGGWELCNLPWLALEVEKLARKRVPDYRCMGRLGLSQGLIHQLPATEGFCVSFMNGFWCMVKGGDLIEMPFAFVGRTCSGSREVTSPGNP